MSNILHRLGIIAFWLGRLCSVLSLIGSIVILVSVLATGYSFEEALAGAFKMALISIGLWFAAGAVRTFASRITIQNHTEGEPTRTG